MFLEGRVCLSVIVSLWIWTFDIFIALWFYSYWCEIFLEKGAFSTWLSSLWSVYSRHWYSPCYVPAPQVTTVSKKSWLFEVQKSTQTTVFVSWCRLILAMGSKIWYFWYKFSILFLKYKSFAGIFMMEKSVYINLIFCTYAYSILINYKIFKNKHTIRESH